MTKVQQECGLKGKLACVTGASRGIGYATAQTLAAAGADVIVTARDIDSLQDIVKDITALGRSAFPVQADLATAEGVDSLIQQAGLQADSVDILVNNAGVGGAANPNLVEAVDPVFWNDSLFVNLTAPFLLTRGFIPAMRKKNWGRVINMSSTAGKRGVVEKSAYCASKHGLIGLTRAVALEVASAGITVNAICPGPVRTEMLSKALRHRARVQGVSVAEIERMSNPTQRIITPGEVAKMVAYLCEETSAAVTGQALSINGGSLMH